MKARLTIIATGTALLLAGCGSEKTGEFTTDDGKNAAYAIDEKTGETSMTITGKDGTATLRSGTDVPLDLPKGFSLFPGSKVITNTVVKQADGEGTMVMFEAAAPAETVVAHYRDQAKAAGFDIGIEMTTGDTRMIGGERKADGSSLSVTATTKAGENGATTGQLIIGSKPKG
jgi:hypothetical protein